MKRMARYPREYYLGIDPGFKGYIAIIDSNGDIFDTYPMPVLKGKKIDLDMKELYTILWEYCGIDRLAILEKVSAFPKQGVVSMFRFGQTFGAIEMALVATAIPYQLVTPKTWQKVMLAGENKKDTKVASIKVAQRLFPYVDLKRTDRCTTPDNNKADAILMAEYARRLDGGKKK